MRLSARSAPSVATLYISHDEELVAFREEAEGDDTEAGSNETERTAPAWMSDSMGGFGTNGRIGRVGVLRWR